MENTVKPYPGYRNAVAEIVAIVTTEGHGKLITHEQFDEWFDLVEPKIFSKNEFNRYSWEKCYNMERTMDLLLVDHRICLHSIRGEGYQILHPAEQITRGIEKNIKKARNQVGKVIEKLTHVDTELLTLEDQRQRMESITSAAKLKSYFYDKLQIKDKPEDDKED